MKNNDLLSKTINHNDKLRKSTREDVRPLYKHTKEREAVKTYRERKADMVNILTSPKDTLSVYSKAVRTDNLDRTDIDVFDVVDSGKDVLQQLHNKIKCSKENNKKIMTLFPEVKMAGEIIISSTLSPNKLTEAQLNYKLEKSFELKDEDVQSSILSHISDYIEKHYKVSEKLPDILYESLMVSGACPYLVLSEAVVDDVVNADLLAKMSLESYTGVVDGIVDNLTKPVKLIKIPEKISQSEELTRAKNKSLSTEERLKSLAKAMISQESIKVTDNHGIFTVSKLQKELRSSIIKQSLRGNAEIALESTDKINYFDLFRDRQVNAEYKPTIIIPDKKMTTRKAIGKPLVKRLPTESVFPVLSLGNRDEHLGYFVLLDDKGEPITSETSKSSFERLNASINGETFTANPITSVYQDLKGADGNCVDLDSLYNMYEEVMNQQLFEMFKQSVYGEEIEIANSDDFNYISFTRALQAQKTTVLFVPKESLIYFALFYNDTGLGKTLLEDLNTIFSMRAILLFAKVMAQTRNAIDITDVIVDLDPADPDPDGTMEQIKADLLKLRANDFPLGENDPFRLLDWIQKAGLVFNFRNHPKIPEMSIDFQKNKMQYDEPDSEFYENLGKQAISGMGLPPEVIDQAYSPDFAAGVFQNSALLAKRTTMYQNNFTPEVTKFISAIVYTDEDLRDELKEIIRENKGAIEESMEIESKVLKNLGEDEFMEYYLDELSKNIYVELPRISEGNINNLQQEFEDYRARVESALEVVLSDDMFGTDDTPGMEDRVRFLRVSLLALLCRRWAADNNYLPELFGLVGVNNEDSKEALESVESHIGGVYQSVIRLLNEILEIREAGGKDLERIENSASDGDTSSTSW